PALRKALHTGASYEAFVAVGTVGLLVPLNTLFAGIGVIVDRESGARRELLAAPIPRSLLPLGNLVVALGVSALQIAALIAAALSLAVVAAFAALLTVVAVRVFTRAAVR